MPRPAGASKAGKMTIVLAFDIATTSGWAVTDKGGGPAWGHFGIESDSDENNNGRALYHFRREVYRLIDKYKPTVLAWEMPIPASKHTAAYDEYVKGGIGILRCFAFELDLQTLPCDLKSVRRHFIGGNPADAKQQVWHRCKVLGYDCKNDDESDAIATWDYASGQLKVQAYGRAANRFSRQESRRDFASRRSFGHRRP